MGSSAWVHSSGPTNANSSSSTNIAMPATAARCRRNRRTTVFHWVRASTSNPTPVTVGGELMSTKADPRVEVGIYQVGDQVECDDHDGGDHHPALHHPGL